MRMLAVEVVEDTLVLSGSVSSFYHKQMAQELVRTVVGRDVEVINSIDVRATRVTRRSAPRRRGVVALRPLFALRPARCLFP